VHIGVSYDFTVDDDSISHLHWGTGEREVGAETETKVQYQCSRHDGK
jgi:hypothetical protein